MIANIAQWELTNNVNVNALSRSVIKLVREVERDGV